MRLIPHPIPCRLSRSLSRLGRAPRIRTPPGGGSPRARNGGRDTRIGFQSPYSSFASLASLIPFAWFFSSILVGEHDGDNRLRAVTGAADGFDRYKVAPVKMLTVVVSDVELKLEGVPLAPASG